jgi:nicotinate-nucleotide pyrophosphorylase (carboxylating)
MSLNKILLEEIVTAALKEDFAVAGDITTDNLISDTQKAEARIILKEAGLIYGLETAAAVFAKLEGEVKLRPLVEEGQKLKKGTPIAELEGSAKSILKGERTALNFLQRLSGIATRTHKFVELVRDYPVQIVDTRKTTPTLRMLEKNAVLTGGAKNHRLGLYDAVMIKDNHLKAVGSIKKAVAKIKAAVPHTVKIEVETENLSQVKEALEAGVDIIMLDNMDLAALKEAVNYIDSQVIVEASGEISAENIKEIAAAGVDIISLGTLTHQIYSLDISLDFKLHPAAGS